MRLAGAARAALATVGAVLAIRCTSFRGADAVSSDAGPPADANANTAAGVGVDATVRTFCATQDASFCADFDEGPDAAAGWSQTETSRSGVVSQTTTAVSAPRAFSSRVGAGGGDARLLWHYPPTAHRTALSFQVKIARPATLAVDDGTAIAELDCVNATDAGFADWSGVWLSAATLPGTKTPDMQLIAGDPPHTLPNLPAGWTLVSIIVDWGPPTTHIKVAFGGSTVLDANTSMACDAKTDAFLLLGMATESTGEAIFDDVVLDVTE